MSAVFAQPSPWLMTPDPLAPLAAAPLAAAPLAATPLPEALAVGVIVGIVMGTPVAVIVGTTDDQISKHSNDI